MRAVAAMLSLLLAWPGWAVGAAPSILDQRPPTTTLQINQPALGAPPIRKPAAPDHGQQTGNGCTGSTAAPGCSNPQPANGFAPPANPPTTPPIEPFGSSTGASVNYQTPALLSADTGNGAITRNYEPGQILVWHRDMAAAQTFAQAVATAGYRVIGRRVLSGLEAVQSVVSIPDGLSVPDAVAALAARFPDAVIDANHRYRPLADHPALDAIGWRPAIVTCTRQARVGIVDTWVATTRPLLSGRDLVVRSMLPAGLTPAPTDHGTAVTARLAALLPATSLRVAAVFRQRDEDHVDTTVQWLLLALDWLAQQRVAVINMSLGGPPNRLLQQAIERLRRQGVRIVAAVAESGPDGPPVYPAAYPGAVAVTAVDIRLRVYPRARAGPEVDFAAPGVDLRVPGIKRYVTGTSHAAPFVTAALVAAGGSVATLAAAARDLGAAGRDNVFGHGLVRFAGLCDAIAG